MAGLHRAPEPEVLKPLLERARLSPDSRLRVIGHAKGLLADLRAAQSKGWVNQFLQEYRLNSSEGVALLSLAEAIGLHYFPHGPNASRPEKLTGLA